MVSGQGPVTGRFQRMSGNRAPESYFSGFGLFFEGKVQMTAKKTIWGWLLFFISIFTLTTSSQGMCAVSIIDDAGNPITLPHAAKRVVSLYGGITEILCAIGGLDKLVGVTKRDSWPPAVRDKPKIGTHMRPNLELILGLKPDLVIQGSTRPGSQLVVEKLKEFGIKVAVFNPYSFSTLYSVIERISILCGLEQNGETLISNMKRTILELERRYPIMRHPKIIFEVSYPSLLFAGGKNMVDDIIEKAGGVNVIKKDKKFVRYSLEQILVDDPDVYIIQKGPMNRSIISPAKRPGFDALRAIKQGHVLYVDEFIFSRPGPRCVKAVETLRRYLYEISNDSRNNNKSDSVHSRD